MEDPPDLEIVGPGPHQIGVVVEVAEAGVALATKQPPQHLGVVRVIDVQPLNGPAVAEAAVVGKPHEITGQSVAAFVTLKAGDWDKEKLSDELKKWVGHEIGAFARPEQIRFTDALPKTRSGKIMRRLLREIVIGNTVSGDVTTLEDLTVLSKLSQDEE